MGEHMAAVKAALEALDADRLVGLYADSFVFEDVAAGQTVTTRAELMGYFEALFSIPDVRFTDVTVFECGDRAAGTWVWSGTNSRGEAFSIKGASIFELGDDGVVRETVVYDPRPALS